MADGPVPGSRFSMSWPTPANSLPTTSSPPPRADLLRQLNRHAEAADAYRQAITLARTDPERRYLTRRLTETLRQT